MKYLIEDKGALYDAKGEEIFRLISNANSIITEEGPEGLQRYEDRLLHEFYFVKGRIDIIHTEDRSDAKELTWLQYRLSVLNEALLYIIRIAPEGNLAKDYNSNNV